MATQYGLRTKDASGIVMLDTSTTAIRSVHTLQVTGNGAWDQYFSIPQIKADSIVVVQSPVANAYSGVEAWWTAGRLHLRRAGSNKWNVQLMSYGDPPDTALKYGIRATNGSLKTQIDNVNRVMTVADSGSFPIGRRAPGDYITHGVVTFKSPITTTEQPYVFLTSATGMMVAEYRVLGSPGRWTGFTVAGWFGGEFGLYYYTVKWMVGVFKASPADADYGVRIRDDTSERIFSSSDNIILLNGTPSSDRFRPASDSIVSGPTYWSSFQMPWTGDVNDYFLASSLIGPFTDGYNFFDNPAGFRNGNRSILKAYAGSEISSTNAAGVNGRTLFAGRPMRPL